MMSAETLTFGGEDYIHAVCCYCNSRVRANYPCQLCHTFWYCSRECSMLDWPRHKKECNEIIRQRSEKKCEMAKELDVGGKGQTEVEKMVVDTQSYSMGCIGADHDSGSEIKSITHGLNAYLVVCNMCGSAAVVLDRKIRTTMPRNAQTCYACMSRDIRIECEFIVPYAHVVYISISKYGYIDIKKGSDMVDLGHKDATIEQDTRFRNSAIKVVTHIAKCSVCNSMCFGMVCLFNDESIIDNVLGTIEPCEHALEHSDNITRHEHITNVEAMFNVVQIKLEITDQLRSALLLEKAERRLLLLVPGSVPWSIIAVTTPNIKGEMTKSCSFCGGSERASEDPERTRVIVRASSREYHASCLANLITCEKDKITQHNIDRGFVLGQLPPPS